jgi:threonine dehydrogenase-like Zn-dependent dehydrogenase
VPFGTIVNKGITIRANQASVKRLLPRLIDHMLSGLLDPKGLITQRIRLLKWWMPIACFLQTG